MKNEIIGIICVYNEELNLKPFLDHMQKYVDYFVAYDDGSTDKTIEILEKHPKVKVVIKSNNQSKDRKWKERHNRKKVLETAKKVAKTDNPWVFCMDPDERIETRLLKDLRKITDKYNNQDRVLTFHFRELWDDLNHYRVDDIWDKKQKGLLFQLKDKMTFDYKQEHHIPWAYEEIVNNGVMLDYNIYHLKMVRTDEREKRRDLYNKLDPNKEMQKIGYDYLVDTNNLELRKVTFKERYNVKFVPDYYRNK